MNTISFLKVREIIINQLRSKSIDAIYNNTHPMFDGFKYLNQKSIEKIQNDLNIGFTPKIFDSSIIDRIIDRPWNYYVDLRDITKLKESKRHYLNDKRGMDELNTKITNIEKTILNVENREKILLDLSNNHYRTYDELKLDILKIKNISVKDVPEFSINLLLKNFKNWLENNYENIKNFETIKKNKIEDFKLSIENVNEDKKLTNKKLDDSNKSLSILQSKLNEIQTQISLTDNLKKLNNEKIKNNLLEIDKLENTEEFKNKEPYIKRIVELKAENYNLPVLFEKDLFKLQTELKKIKTEVDELKNQIANLKKEVVIYNQKLNDINSKKNSFIENDIKFDKVKETNILKELYFIFANDKNKFFENKEIDHTYFINTSEIFKEAFKEVDKIQIEKITKSLSSVFYNQLPSKTKNSYVKFRPYNTELTDNVNGNNDVPVIIFALRNSFKEVNILKTTQGILYLNLGNGIFAKMLIRNNKENIENDIALYSSNLNIQNIKYIYGGYSKSGFLLNDGIYIITKELIFEIYFEASAFLTSQSNNFQQMQDIFDSKKINDEEIAELNRINSLSDDDDD